MRGPFPVILATLSAPSIASAPPLLSRTPVRSQKLAKKLAAQLRSPLSINIPVFDQSFLRARPELLSGPACNLLAPVSYTHLTLQTILLV